MLKSTGYYSCMELRLLSVGFCLFTMRMETVTDGGGVYQEAAELCCSQ